MLFTLIQGDPAFISGLSLTENKDFYKNTWQHIIHCSSPAVVRELFASLPAYCHTHIENNCFAGKGQVLVLVIFNAARYILFITV
jgi:hypothetical protein